jgi:hypothetical protein
MHTAEMPVPASKAANPYRRNFPGQCHAPGPYRWRADHQVLTGKVTAVAQTVLMKLLTDPDDLSSTGSATSTTIR